MEIPKPISPLERHETRRFDLADVGMLAPVTVSEENIAIRIQAIRWPQSPKFDGKQRYDQKSFSQRRRCIWPRPDRCHPVEEDVNQRQILIPLYSASKFLKQQRNLRIFGRFDRRPTVTPAL